MLRLYTFVLFKNIALKLYYSSERKNIFNDFEKVKSSNANRFSYESTY